MRVANLKKGGCVCEVGPGPGALTRSILNNGIDTVFAVEKDRRFLPSLEVNLKSFCYYINQCIVIMFSFYNSYILFSIFINFICIATC